MSGELITSAALCVAAFVAGAINALAGGGTLLTFPVLLSVMSSVEANATSTVALMPGSAAGAWGYRRELRGSRSLLMLLGPPSMIGGLIGSLLVVWLPARVFDVAVPWLLLTASLLFLFQPLFGRIVRSRSAGESTPGTQATSESAGARSRFAVATFQVVVGVYGGYFGAGIGILMLTALAFICASDIHRLNAIKTILAACINGVSVFVFVAEGKVVWRYGLIMAASGIAGGFCGAHFGRQLPKTAVRWFVVFIGLAITVSQFAKQLTTPSP
jgi:uncharacterized membrane protein YfcA